MPSSFKGVTLTGNSHVKLPVGDNAQRPSGGDIASGQLRYNNESGRENIEFRDEGTTSWRSRSYRNGVIATGGTEFDIFENGQRYRIHRFASDGTLTVTRGGKIEYLLVGGGGGVGSSWSTGGGGGGAVRPGYIELDEQDYAIVIGQGRAINLDGGTGDSTTAFGLTAGGGGQGGQWTANGTAGSNGGSGGGGGATNTGAAQSTGGAGGAFGNDGGRGFVYDGSGNYSGGGGGGAGGPGLDAQNSNFAGAGGAGLLSNIAGLPVYYGAGGSGGNNNNLFIPSGAGASDPGFPGLAGTGTGGGANSSGSANTKGAGADGVVFVKYPVYNIEEYSEVYTDYLENIRLEWDFSKPECHRGDYANRVVPSIGDQVRGVITGTPALERAGTHRAAYSFTNGNTADQSIDITAPANGSFIDSSGTLMIWLWADPIAADGGYEEIIGVDTYINSGGGWRFYRYDNTQIRFWESDNQVSTNISGGIVPSAWHLYTVTRDNTVVKVYRDTTLLDTGTSSLQSWTGNVLYIGGSFDGGSQQLDGDVAVVRFYNQALTAAQIEQYYNFTKWRFGY